MTLAELPHTEMEGWQVLLVFPVACSMMVVGSFITMVDIGGCWTTGASIVQALVPRPTGIDQRG